MDVHELLSDILDRAYEVMEQGLTVEQTLDEMEPIRTGYSWVPEDYDWPKKPENWLETI